jgi:hypothetical protein
MRAKYDGVCARTGRAYRSGAEIVKTPQGWALAEKTSGGHVPDWQTLITPEGERKYMDISRAYCGVCLPKREGVDIKKIATFPADVKMTRQGDNLVCPSCERTLQIVTEAMKRAEREALAEEGRRERLAKDPKFIEAAATGKPVLIESSMEPCNVRDLDCSLDYVATYAMPDGNYKEERTHTY